MKDVSRFLCRFITDT